MIDKVKISPEEYKELHEKGCALDINQVNLEYISHSGCHIHDILSEQEEQEEQ